MIPLYFLYFSDPSFLLTDSQAQGGGEEEENYLVIFVKTVSFEVLYL